MRLAFTVFAATALTNLGMLLSPPAWAEDTSHKDWLIPGSSDTIHDFSGIAIGMPCDEAISLGKKISTRNGELAKKYTELRTNLDGLRVSVHWNIYEVALNPPGSPNRNQISFSCFDDGRSSVVFELLREFGYAYADSVAPPPVTSVHQIFQEKFGVPTVEYDPYNLAILFNRKGVIDSKENGCGSFSGGHLYDAIVEFNADKCSYTLAFTAVPSRRRPGTIDWITIHIMDHLRLENAARALEKHKLETTPTALPKL